MRGLQQRSAAALLALTFCHSAPVGQSPAPDGWKKVEVDGAFTFLLPEDMEQTDAVGVEDLAREYTNGRVLLLVVHQPWGAPARRPGRRRGRGMKGYQEKEMRVDGRRAYVQTFHTDRKGVGRTYSAVLTVVTRGRPEAIELRVTLWSSNASDLRAAGRIFASIDFP